MTEEARGEEGRRDSAARSQSWRVGRALTAGLRQRCSCRGALRDLPILELVEQLRVSAERRSCRTCPASRCQVSLKDIPSSRSFLLTTSYLWGELRLKHGCKEHARVHGLAVLPVPPDHGHLRAGALGEVHLQHSPFYHGGHGGLHLLRLRAHPCASGLGVLLRTVRGAA
ncbi:hypothetical protein SRHO_G00244480 [Serrasalmus rhombeus]